MSERRPLNTARVRIAAVSDRDVDCVHPNSFDVWLDGVRAAARREGQAEAWDEGYGAGELCGLTAEQPDHACPINPYRNGEGRHVDQ